jgi:glycosyltransferase involved in cell wall biosynthesis
MNEGLRPADTTKISVVIETDSFHAYDDITIADCLDAIRCQTYPRELVEVVVVDGGKVPALGAQATGAFPDVRVLTLPGGTKFEQKNLGAQAATGEIVAFVDADCAPPPNWLATIVGALASAPPDIAGVQGITVLSAGWLAAEVSALFYGPRRRRGGPWAGRLVTDNCAFRRDVFRRFAFEHATFSTVVDTLFLRRLERAGYHLLVCEDLRMAHSFPGLATRAGVGWFFARAYGVGYYMVKARQIEPDLRGSAFVRGGGIGWPLLALGKAVLDLRQVWENRRRLNARFLAALPLFVPYELTLFVGGLAALLRLPPPRWS